MFRVRKATLEKFFVEGKRYIVPFFQRGYVWKKENWQELWDNIEEMYDNDKQEEHFLGTVIVRPLAATSIGDTGKFELIDGQQRFTTISILLKALAETCIGEDETTLKKNIEECLSFEDDEGEKFLRIKHSKIDGDCYKEILNNPGRCEEFKLTSSGETQSKFVECYVFFRKKIKELERINDPNNKIKLKDVILKKMSVVSMLLSEIDYAQEIFDTVNSLGQHLEVNELVKNYIFSKRELDDMYPDYWRNIFEGKSEEDEETIKFWTGKKKVGGIRRSNIELLLRYFLEIKTEETIKADKLFREYKKWWDGFNLDKKTEMLKELREYAEVFRSFPFQELDFIKPTEYDKRLFHILDAWSLTTPYPLILSYCKKYGEDEKEKRDEFFRALESYLMRRYVCKMTRKDYNKLFLELLNKKDFINGETPLSNILLEYEGDARKFPKDAELKNAFIENYFDRSAIPKEILYSIALNQISKKSDIDGLSDPYTLEHIMPQSLKGDWNPSNMTDGQKEKRKHYLKTLGNLTLIPSTLNSSMQDSAWSEKKKELKKHSLLKITTKYVDKEKWDEEEIEKRAKDLYAIAKKAWALPPID